MVTFRKCAFLLVLFCSAAFAQQQLPKGSGPQPQGQSAQPSATSSGEQRGTERAPLFVKQLPAESDQAKAAEERQHQHEQLFNERLVAWGTVALAVVTFALAAVTTGLAVFTLKLWRATSQLVRGAEDTARRQLRAYVQVTEAASRLDGTELWVAVTLKNTGQSPAYDVEHRCAIVGVSKGDTPNLGMLDMGPVARGVVGSAGELTTTIPLLDEVTPAKKLLLEQEKAMVIVWGHIAYRDIFNAVHSTKYKLILRGHGVRHGRLHPAEDGNEAD